MHDSPSASEARSVTLSNPTSKRAIADYVESQARSEKVQHAEKVKSEHLFDRDYDCRDVHTQRDRYWVITSPSNLYSQRYFPSLDFTLSFHVGVTARVMAMQRGAPDLAQFARLTPVWRRWEQAAGSYDAAEEAEDCRGEMQGNTDPTRVVAFQTGDGSTRYGSAQASRRGAPRGVAARLVHIFFER